MAGLRGRADDTAEHHTSAGERGVTDEKYLIRRFWCNYFTDFPMTTVIQMSAIFGLIWFGSQTKLFDPVAAGLPSFSRPPACAVVLFFRP
ncbi:MAG: hypothetical protein ABSH36_12885 [Solirubrobacteraceae bacterium]|jgi:hypothetical protein